MKKLFNFVFWPALAGLVLALVLLQVPHLIRLLPALAAYFPQPLLVEAPAESSMLSFRSAIKKALPAVVSINNLQLVSRQGLEVLTYRNNPIAQRIKSFEDQNNTLGSGVIISPDGYIITSYHVMFNPALEIINPEQDITITLNDKRNIEAELISLDAKNDLALLKVDAANLTHLQLANSSYLQVGDIVLAIGNPRNVGQSASFGIISALWQRDDSYLIQTDAAVNPGNSGGALIDINGNLIGVNSTIVSESGGSEGISFAVPASKALNLLAQYLTEQKLDTGNSGYLGVSASGLPLDKGRELLGKDIQGFVVNSVAQNSAADLAGIRMNDVITAVNNVQLKMISNTDEAEAWKTIANVSARKPGELIMLQVYRNGEFIKVPTILGIGEPKVFPPDELEIEGELGVAPVATAQDSLPAVNDIQ